MFDCSRTTTILTASVSERTGAQGPLADARGEEPVGRHPGDTVAEPSSIVLLPTVEADLSQLRLDRLGDDRVAGRVQ